MAVSLVASLLFLLVAGQQAWGHTVAPILISVKGYNLSEEIELDEPLNENDYYLAGMLDQKYLDPPEDPRLLEQAGLFEGDILQPIENYMYNALRLKERIWEDGIIPYALERGASRELRAIIARAILVYSENTCIKWVPKDEDTKNYVLITTRDRGCYSLIGMEGGLQQLNLGEGCQVLGIALHEMMHAVGFFHEQSRPDRDEYVNIDWDNVREGMEYNFQKMSENMIDNQDEPYDYASIMHYQADAFAVDPNRPTIIPLDESVTKLGGYEFTETDLRKLNKLYKCNKKGPTPKPTGRPNPTGRPKPTGRPNPTGRPKPTGRPSPTGRPRPTGRPYPPGPNPHTWPYPHIPLSPYPHPRPIGPVYPGPPGIPIPYPSAYGVSNDCIDLYTNCTPWYWQGLCTTLKSMMTMYCPRSCGLCDQMSKR